MTAGRRWAGRARFVMIAALVIGGCGGREESPTDNEPLAQEASALVSADYDCTASAGATTQTLTLPITFAGTPPATVAPGKKVSMTGFQLTATLPETMISSLKREGVTWLSGTFTTIDVTATDAKVATVNVAGTGMAMPRTTLPATAAAVTFKVPATPKTVGHWNARKKGTMDFSTGDVDFTLTTSIGGDVTVTCTISRSVVIAQTTVS